MSTNQAIPNNLPVGKRLITSHNDAGQAVFHTVDQGHLKPVLGGVAQYNTVYSTVKTPIDLENEEDICVNEANQDLPLSIRGGSVCRIVDMEPGGRAPMHRTESVDYGIVIFGEAELILDSGETQLMRPGDVVVQRATKHSWYNPSKENWVRVAFVLLEALPVRVQGQVLGEELSGLSSDHPSTANFKSH
ncbi:uncharacterized protein PV07_03100 [Cladophialophora immunda]|uniref:Cupin type-2 domain-containing protein n=1 Tax=Cladophialophora immunda TaxID=569365 RepID=A0A0D1ZTP9_9EURO|nr:uncharacterized protein PV07_03100 [Cladophialophora immunda]KIW31451.1 hypothetical protein PV07_03100 [Cladophialophora immunda]